LIREPLFFLPSALVLPHISLNEPGQGSILQQAAAFSSPRLNFGDSLAHEDSQQLLSLASAI
jgi:hypothetical protein